MKKFVLPLICICCCETGMFAQDIKAKDVPAVVKTAFAQKYAITSKVSWEKEDGNFEANWGGKSGEDTAAQFSPSGSFVECEIAMPSSQLPTAALGYIKSQYKNTAIKEAGRITDADGAVTYSAEVKGKELIFDADGNFLKANKAD